MAHTQLPEQSSRCTNLTACLPLKTFGWLPVDHGFVAYSPQPVHNPWHLPAWPLSTLHTASLCLALSILGTSWSCHSRHSAGCSVADLFSLSLCIVIRYVHPSPSLGEEPEAWFHLLLILHGNPCHPLDELTAINQRSAQLMVKKENETDTWQRSRAMF